MTNALKVVRYEVQNVFRNRWVLAYGAFFFAVTDVLLRLGGDTPRALLSLMNAVLLLIPLVTLVFGTIYWHSSREFTELLLAQPVERSALFHGLFAGLVLPLTVAFALGMTAPLLLHRAVSAENVGSLALMLVTGAALTAVFGALAVLIGGLVEDRLKGVALALGVWLLLSVAYDALVLTVAVSFSDQPLERVMLGLTFLNPIDLARVLLMLRFDVSALMGYTGAVFAQLLGHGLGIAAALAGLFTWTLLPGLLALRTFRRRDF
jgi:Cu-processing system permease protein